MNRIERLKKAEELINLVLADIKNVDAALDQWPEAKGPDRGLLGSARWHLTYISNDADIRKREPDYEKAQLKRLADLGRAVGERIQSPEKHGIPRMGCFSKFLLAFGVMVLLCFLALGPIGPGNQRAPESSAMQRARSLNLLLFQYATDHNGQYPAGKTSTEVFQKLIDEKYTNDPSIFYLPMHGKTEAASSKLMAENVCFDVTGGADLKASDQLPVVFLTGYTVTYTAGARATCDNLSARPFDGTAVSYKGNSSLFIKADAQGNILHFVPDNFDLGFGKYAQLRP